MPYAHRHPGAGAVPRRVLAPEREARRQEERALLAGLGCSQFGSERLFVRGGNEPTPYDRDGAPEVARLLRHQVDQLVVCQRIRFEASRLEGWRAKAKEVTRRLAAQQAGDLIAGEGFLEEIALLYDGAGVREKLPRFAAGASLGVVEQCDVSSHG